MGDYRKLADEMEIESSAQPLLWNRRGLCQAYDKLSQPDVIPLSKDPSHIPDSAFNVWSLCTHTSDFLKIFGAV